MDICTGTTRCDTLFTYCLQPIGSNTLCVPQAVSETAFDDRPIDFTQATVLGLPNPLPLSGVSERWEVREPCVSQLRSKIIGHGHGY